MRATSRREFLRAASGATAGVASWLALGKAPAFAQKRQLTFLSWNHFVPASDDELRRQAEAFGTLPNCEVREDPQEAREHGRDRDQPLRGRPLDLLVSRVVVRRQGDRGRR